MKNKKNHNDNVVRIDCSCGHTYWIDLEKDDFKCPKCGNDKIKKEAAE